MALMRKGAENRHTGETRLNRESSRSHSVFTCVLERQSKNQATGITNVLFSRLNLIDLAGELSWYTHLRWLCTAFMGWQGSSALAAVYCTHLQPLIS
jgi:hypothetical protein